MVQTLKFRLLETKNIFKPNTGIRLISIGTRVIVDILFTMLSYIILISQTRDKFSAFVKTMLPIRRYMAMANAILYLLYVQWYRLLNYLWHAMTLSW